jgi:Domain of unknown function (DUF4032)
MSKSMVGPELTALPTLIEGKADVSLFIPERYRRHLGALPWQYPLEMWQKRRVKMISVKSGLSRHVVRFVESHRRRFAIKETTLQSARREFMRYIELSKLEIPTLLPVGIVARNEGVVTVETHVGRLREEKSTGYLITALMEKVVPDSFLFRRGFSTKNRNRIWDAVIRLFIQMHSRGVYWGDASLANMLIKFSKEEIPELGYRTRLGAVLADAETLEIHHSLSDSLRHADVEFFLESMLWTEADLKASGRVRDPMMTQEDQQYLLTQYKEGYAVEQEMRSFELVTHIDVDKLLGNFDVKGYGPLLLRHINEHKWYLSERRGREITLVEAAEDWYREIFRPVCRLFNQHGLLGYFPDKTASSLYVEIMEHKYLMSEKERRDVGLVAALEDYAARDERQGPLSAFIGSILKELTQLLTPQTSGVKNIYLA